MHGAAPHASTGASPRPASAAPTAASPGTAIPACRRSQLAAGGLGISAAAGTAILTTLATAAPNARGSQCHAASALSVALPGGSGALRINETFYVCGAFPGAGAFVSA